MCEICSKLTIKTPERRDSVVLVSLLLILNKFHILFWSFGVFIKSANFITQLFIIPTLNIFMSLGRDKKYPYTQICMFKVNNNGARITSEVVAVFYYRLSRLFLRGVSRVLVFVTSFSRFIQSLTAIRERRHIPKAAKQEIQ